MLRKSSLAVEGPLQVSKWLTTQVLLGFQEMRELVEACTPLIFCGSAVVDQGQGGVSAASFLEAYRDYVEALKEGRLPDAGAYRRRFSDLWTLDPDTLYAIEPVPGRELIRACRPVVQLQAHSFGYSQDDGKFRPMILGKDAVLWGIQFGYPQIFQDNKTRQVHKVDQSPLFPNTGLYRQVQRWLRGRSVPTPFVVDGELTHVPIRLGKECFPWINGHPQLKGLGITVQV